MFYISKVAQLIVYYNLNMFSLYIYTHTYIRYHFSKNENTIPNYYDVRSLLFI